MERPKAQIEPVTNAVHLCIDMQNIFAKGGVWETPWMERVLPAIVALTALNPERTIFTRFITPETPDQRPGRWQHYFQRWRRATRAELPSRQLDLVPELERFAPPAFIVDKPGYSAFTSPKLIAFSSNERSAPSSFPAPRRMCVC